MEAAALLLLLLSILMETTLFIIKDETRLILKMIFYIPLRKKIGQLIKL